MFFSEKCADPDEKSYYACGNSSRPSLFAKVPLLGETELLSTAKVVVSYVSSNGRHYLPLLLTSYTQHVSTVVIPLRPPTPVL